MTIALWALVAAVVWIGLIIASQLHDTIKELRTIRQLLQVGGGLQSISVPANILHLVDQLAESVIGRNRAERPNDER